MGTVVFCARLVLMLVFGVAGWLKLPRPAGLERTYASLGVPGPLRKPAAVALPLAELAVACLLPWRASAVAGAALASVLALLFTGAVAIALVTRRTVPCSCFGNLGHGTLDRATLARDLLLVALSGATLAAFLARPALRPWLEPAVPWSRLSVPALVAISLAGLTVLVASCSGWLITVLVRQNARLLRQLVAARLAGESGGGGGLPVGSPAPALDVAGGGDRAPPGLALFRTLLIFADQSCGVCAALLPEIAAWQDALASAGDGLAGRAQILVVSGRAAAERYGVTGTPVALVVSEDQRIASRLASGPEEIRHLYRHFWHSVMSPATVEVDAVEVELANGP